MPAKTGVYTVLTTVAQLARENLGEGGAQLGLSGRNGGKPRAQEPLDRDWWVVVIILQL